MQAQEKAEPRGASAVTATGGNQAGALAVRAQFGPFNGIAQEAHHLYLDGDSQAALHAANAAMLLAKSAGDYQSERYLTYTQCSALREQGRHEEVVDRALTLLDQIGDDDPVWRAKALAILAHANGSLSRTAQAMDAVSEAESLLALHGAGTFNHMSATLAVAIALQPLRCFELALNLLTRWLPLYHEYGMYFAAEMSLVEAQWGVTLQLAGEHEQAREHLRACQSYALRTRRAAATDPSPHSGLLRAAVYEAFVLAQLGDLERAEVLLWPIPEEDLHADFPEHDLAYLTLGHVAIHYGSPDRARLHFERVVDTAGRAGRDMWRFAAQNRLAELEVAVHGPHPAHDWYRGQVLALHQQAVHEAVTRARELRERALVRQLREASDELTRAALLDPLTGLANRRALTEATAVLDGERGAVFVDVDHFKQVNDTFSHEIGDLVLQRIAGLLNQSTRDDDLVVRYGGDEFVIICAGGGAGSNAVAQRVHAAVRDHDWSALAADLQVTVSVGVATSIGGGDPLAMADEALYRAKRGGRNQVATAIKAA
jgi:diguanylate cyclase (GGDEF)-like protein